MLCSWIWYLLFIYTLNMYLTNKEFLYDNGKIIELMKRSSIIDNDDRVDFATKYLKDKKVLNVWCLNHDLWSYNEQHDMIKSLSKCIVGVDIVSEAKELWWDIEIGDVCDTDFCKDILEKYGKFEMIFAGELIEHLDNYKLFLDNLYLLLEDNGIVILSTPNPYWLHYQLQNFLYWYMLQWNTDHTCRIDPFQLYFNTKEKYHLIDFSWLNNTKSLEHKIIKFLWKKQLCFNYLAVLKKNG